MRFIRGVVFFFLLWIALVLLQPFLTFLIPSVSVRNPVGALMEAIMVASFSFTISLVILSLGGLIQYKFFKKSFKMPYPGIFLALIYVGIGVLEIRKYLSIIPDSPIAYEGVGYILLFFAPTSWILSSLPLPILSYSQQLSFFIWLTVFMFFGAVYYVFLGYLFNKYVVFYSEKERKRKVKK